MLSRVCNFRSCSLCFNQRNASVKLAKKQCSPACSSSIAETTVHICVKLLILRNSSAVKCGNFKTQCMGQNCISRSCFFLSFYSAIHASWISVFEVFNIQKQQCMYHFRVKCWYLKRQHKCWFLKRHRTVLNCKSRSIKLSLVWQCNSRSVKAVANKSVFSASKPQLQKQ